MAGAGGGMTPEARRRAAEAEAGPGGTVREEQRAGITDYIPVPLRDTESSALGAIGSFADKYLGFGHDRRRSRVLSGLASQWYGLDEGGNPSVGETPGIVYETRALAALPAMLMRLSNSAVARQVGLSEDDPYFKFVQNVVFADPDFAVEASNKADEIHKAVREDIKLKAPRGFEENSQEALGVMLGQLPIPGRAAAKAGETAANPGVMDRIAKAAEWFTPTVDPKVGNYGFGALTGGALGTMGDEEEIPVVLPGDQPGLYDVRPTYKDGSVGYSGNAIDQEAIAQLAAQEEGETEEHADGGRVGGMGKLVKAYADKYATGTFGNGTKQYAELVRKYLRTVPTDHEDLELLDEYAHEPWGWDKGEREHLRRLVDEHAVELPPELPIYRGIEQNRWDKDYNIDWSRIGDKVNTSQLSVLPTTTSEGEARNFASLSGGRGAVMTLRRKAPIRGFPLLQSGQDEWLLTRPDEMTIRNTRPHPVDPDSLAVDVDYTQMKKYAKGGDVNKIDNCDGGMAAVRGMKSKYAEGGKVGTSARALKAIKDAIAHLDNGDTPSALRTLQSNPEVTRDPAVAQAMAKLRHPSTSKAGRQMLEAPVAVDSNRVVEATFAKGGKVSGVGQVAKKAADLTKGGPLGKGFNWNTAARKKVRAAYNQWEREGMKGDPGALASKVAKDLGAPEADVLNVLYEIVR